MPRNPTRREFLATAAGAAVIVVAPSFGHRATASTLPFLHGVASGDPLSDRVVIWTRLTPTADAVPGSGRGAPVTVTWQVARDEAFTDVIAHGTTVADARSDHTVQVDVTGLDADAYHWYRFTALGATSPVGRTRTTAAPTTTLDSLRLGIVTCAEFEFGRFGVYRLLAERDDIDAVIHLGDYVYEFGRSYGPLSSPGERLGRRHEPPHECLTLSDYRMRYGQHRRDSELQAMHAAHPVIAMYDDHEVANDTWREGAENHSAEEGSFANRARAGHQAWREWLPLRLPDPAAPEKVERTFQFGNLAQLWMLDERRYRDEPPASAVVGYGSVDPAIDDPSRTMLGAPQREWLTNGLRTSAATWKVLGNPVMMMPIDVGPPLAGAFDELLRGLPLPRPPLPPPLLIDAWDGYAAERQRLIDTIVSARVSNVVVLTGDYHESFVGAVPVNQATYQTDRRAAAIEFVAPAVTSPNLSETLALAGLPQAQTINVLFEANLQASNPWVSYHEGFANGYGVVEFRADGMQYDFVFIDDRTKARPVPRDGASWRVSPGRAEAVRAPGPLATRVRAGGTTRERRTVAAPETIPATGAEQNVVLWAATLLASAGFAARLGSASTAGRRPVRD